MIESLRHLLLSYSETESSEQRAQIEVEIWQRFGAERSVLVWDMSAFSLVTRRHGIIHYLSMVRRMQEATRPIVHAHKGVMVKFEADNGFAVFQNSQCAILAAIEMNEAFKEENVRHAGEFDIRISCGIDHGRILLIEGRDFFGDPVNIACKLGEDLAGPGEILVTQSAIKDMPESNAFDTQPIRLTMSGIELEAASITPKGVDS
ncbi:MAG: adenylate/guanylate cyclase domain-containing protein [Verrucomicrobia bacterium]|nr:adenylate/guanylate cyclase domain-containing protein [Verrucomicrobiota bacterium]